MIDEELARSAIELLGTAAAMLMEDAHLQLATTPSDVEEARAIAATLQRIGTDLDALGTAAVVLTQRRGEIAASGRAQSARSMSQPVRP